MAKKSTKTKSSEHLEVVPAEWPGGFGLYKHSKQTVQVNLGTIVGLWVLSVLFSVSISPLHDSLENIFSLIISAISGAALALVYLASVKGKNVLILDAIKGSFKYFINMVVLTFLTAIIAIGSLLLLIVPFFIVMPRLVLATYFLVDKNLNAVDAIKASWKATENNAGKVWGIFGVGLLMALLLVTIIGIPVAIYLLIMYSASMVILYKYLAK
jgi:hypothetical protein